MLNTPIAQMDLSVRIINTLEDNQIIYAYQLIAQTYETLMKLKNFGETTLKEVRASLKRLGLDAPKWDKPKHPTKPARPRHRAKTQAGIIGGLWS